MKQIHCSGLSGDSRFTNTFDLASPLQIFRIDRDFTDVCFFFLQLTQEALQQSYREVQELQKHRDLLQKQLGDIATKIDSGMIPDPEDLELPALQSEGAALTWRRRRQYLSVNQDIRFSN